MRIIFMLLVVALLTSCRGCSSSHAERKAGVQKVCPTCTFVESQSEYFATDTAATPNIVYKVRFKVGGVFYKASDVDDLIRVN